MMTYIILGLCIIIAVLSLTLLLKSKSFEKREKEYQDDLAEKDIRLAIVNRQVALLKANIDNISNSVAKNKEIKKDTQKVIAVIEDDEVSDEDKDKAVSDMLTKLSSGGLRKRS